jgi:hypothetical protein
MSSSANQYHMSFASGGRKTKRSESIGDDSDPGDVAGDWDSPPVAKGKKTAGLDNNGFMFISVKTTVVIK